MINVINNVQTVIIGFLEQLEKAKSMERGWKTQAARARKTSLVLEKLLKQFRSASVDAQYRSNHD